jgi:TP901 family phage tail tape measure protein
MSLSPAATVFVDVEGDLTKFRRDLDGAAKATEDKFGRATKAAGGALVGVAAGIGIASAKTFVDYDKGLREVFTLIPDGSDALRDHISFNIKEISKVYGQELGDVTAAAYDSISAGINPAEIYPFLEEAGKLAIAGATDISTAVDGLTGVTNAYGIENLSAAEASDIMFATMKAGKTTIDEIATNASKLTPIANELGVGFDQVGASIATVTAVTGNTAEASTQLKAVFSELGKDGSSAFNAFEKATGKSFRQFTADGGTLSEGLVAMQGYAEENDKTLGDMFGSVEAGGAALIIAAEGAEVFDENLANIRDSAGATQAGFEEMEDSVSFKLDKMKASMAIAALNIGEAVAPALVGLADAAAGAAEFLAMLPGPMSAMIVAGIGLVGMFLLIAGPLSRAISLLKLMNLTILANPYVIAAIAIIAFVALVVIHWDTIKTAIGDAAVWIEEKLTKYISEPVGDIYDWFTRLPGNIDSAWEKIKTKTGEAVDYLKAKLGELLAAADSALGPLDEIAGIALNPIGAAKSILTGNGIPGFDDGGIVGGATGSPQLVLAHGGETILPTHKDPNAGAGGGGVYLTMNVSSEVRDPGFFERQAVEITRVVDRELSRQRKAVGQ